MQVHIIPGSVMEWGLCLFTIWFCWWKYGCNVDVIKKFRQMYKRVGAVIMDYSSEPGTKSSLETSEMKHFMRIPVFGTIFPPRSRPKVNEDDEAATTTTRRRSFGDLLDNFVSEELLRPSQGACFVCDSPTKTIVKKEIEQAKPLTNCLDFEETRAPHNPWYVRLFSDFLFWWRKWYVGEQYHVISLKEVMGDEQLKWAITEAAMQEYREKGNKAELDVLIKKHYCQVEALIKKMRAKQPAHPWYALYVRWASWIIGKFLAQIYPQILIRNSQMNLIRKARKSGHPILFLPVHRSHIDYVLISWTLIWGSMRTPCVAAGENLNIPVFSLMMKSVGGFFIKRRFETKAGSKDMLYSTIIHSYMRKTLTNDNDMEFFLEGGRTRTGKPCLPKGGLLNIVMKSLLANDVKDILVVPVNFSYDRIIEGNYIREQLGQPKVNESFASALLALFSSLKPKYGNARVDYGHPFSMKDFVMRHCAEEAAHVPITCSSNSSSSSGISSSNSSISGSESGMEKGEESFTASTGLEGLSYSGQRKVVDALGRHAIYEGIKCYTMTSTNAIAFLLLNKFRNGISLDRLKGEMLALKEELVVRGHDSTFTDEDIESALNHGVKVLGPSLIRVEYHSGSKFLRPVTGLPNVIELSYYSNCLLPIYAMEAVIATGVFKLLGDTCNNNFETNEKLRETELVATCLEYADVLYYEFLLCPPCQSLAFAIKTKIKFMSEQGIFSVSLDPDGENLLEIQSSGSLSRLVFLKNILRPILDAYTTASHVFVRLVDHEAEEKVLQMDMLAEIKKQLQNKAILYGESMALDPIRNLVQRAVHWRVLESHKKDLKNIYCLHDDFNGRDAIEDLILRLGKLRV
ncbi:glycerol-3-phosphate acyltransferase 1, mitochondrial [Folsomia candida]|uniref:Glycerol-3-phosphate acyltransferase 1, mitochondrial n=1 Tax=Folsomia candida TaxID=158441 RepID=A0A226DGB9_FOLCA|nr:glycerol-3-phosphate acyltransferase 1, mitochondrial [Folsomia candida]OXA44180.1 Glycerol-3-phosphate acyltransferase 1, mitochondrial [Folsomia candida]